MLQLLDDHDGSGRARKRLLDGIDAHLAAVAAARGGGDRERVARAEAAVKADPAGSIRINDVGDATVYADGQRYAGGRFEVPTVGLLRARARAARGRAGGPAARLRLWVVDGASPATDIGALQAAAPPRSLFQVASQFNCLESPGRFVTDVAEYLSDPTQGPRASISAFPGTLVRHYAAPAPDGSRFVQVSDGRQLDLLADVSGPGVATVHNGYLRTPDIADPAAFARNLEGDHDAIRVGVHTGIEVVLGVDWDGAVAGAPHRTIAQCFTSTLAAGMYGELAEDDPVMMAVCRQLQRAAYLGTLLAAAAHGAERVVLTLIGGGVFANPMPVIWDAILWAADEARAVLHRDLVVVVNGRTLGQQLPAHLLRAAARDRGGELIRIDRDGGVAIES
jgi:hypothetical protein